MGQRLDLARRGCRDGYGNHRRLESPVMIGPTGAVRVMVATKPVDFRKGAEGLAALVRETMGCRSVRWRHLCVPRQARGSDQAGLLGWHGRVPLRQAAGGRRVSLAEDRGRRHAAVRGAVLGPDRRAGLAACSAARETPAPLSRADLRHSESALRERRDADGKYGLLRL